jgi:putative sigma-54 modulation protein
MNLDITGRQVEITTALREFAEEKLRKLEKLLDGPIDIHIVLGIEKHRHTAEVKVKSRTAILSGTEETNDLYASIREVADKLERQALKHKEKITLKKRAASGTGEVAAAMQAEVDAEARADQPIGEEENPARVIRSERYRTKPISLEDALMDLETTGESIIVFRSSGSERVRVLYRRGDGHFGLIEPEF